MRDEIVIHEAFKTGDLEMLRIAAADSFPNCHIESIGNVLDYAISHSPLWFIRDLLDLGADPNYEDNAGFPSIIAALSTEREDKLEILDLLIAAGADINDLNQRGINDWTPLHYAVAQHDLKAVEFLLSRGADVNARTRIDDYTTPLEEAEPAGLSEIVKILRTALERQKGIKPRGPLASRTAVLRKEIDTAFDSRPYPGDDNIAMREPGCRGYEAEEVWEFFRGKDWREITWKAIREGFSSNDFIAFFTFEGFVYFLPAFLKIAMEDIDHPYDLGDPLIFELWSFPEEVSSLLAPKEKRAVVHVLEFLSGEYKKRNYTNNRAQRALDDYWAYFTDAELGLV